MTSETQLSPLEELIVDNSFLLTVFHGRYGETFIAFLASNEDGVENIAYDYTGGDPVYEHVSATLGQLPWFPIGVGETMNAALEAMTSRIVTDPEKHKAWKSAVEFAVGYYKVTTYTEAFLRPLTVEEFLAHF